MTRSQPRIVADEKVWNAAAMLAPLGEVLTVPATELLAHAAGADYLVVRSVTRIRPRALAGTPVRGVVTATSGVDHLDTTGLDAAGVAWAACPGANATAVAEYVLAVVLDAWAREPGLRAAPVGVVGYGHVGSRVAARLRSWGVNLRVNDPPREQRGDAVPGLPWSGLEAVLSECPIVTLHVPLVRSGLHPTIDLIDRDALSLRSADSLLIHTCRGGVVDEAALVDGPGQWVLDVWSGEPAIDTALVLDPRTRFATPHIAGYSADAKANATRMAFAILAGWLGSTEAEGADGLPPLRHRSAATTAAELALELIGIPAMDSALRAAAGGGSALGPTFERMRAGTPARRDWCALDVEAPACNRGDIVRLFGEEPG